MLQMAPYERAFTLVLQDAIFLATCLATLQKEIHCKLQETCYTLQSLVTTCYGFKKSLQSLQKVEPSFTASVTQRNFFATCVAMALTDKLQRVICPLSNLSGNWFGLATISQSRGCTIKVVKGGGGRGVG